MAKTVEELEAEINKRFDGITNQQKQISDEIARLPGMSKAHAAEFSKETAKLIADLEAKLIKPTEKPKDSPDEKNKALQAQLDAIQKEMTLTKENAARAEKHSAIATELGKYKLCNGALEDVMKALDGQIIKGENGYGAKVTEILPLSGQKTEKEVTLAEAVKNFLDTKPFYKLGDAKGGVGAGGGNSFEGGAKPTHAQLMKNAKLLSEWQTKDPEHVRAESDKAIAGMEAQRGKR